MNFKSRIIHMFQRSKHTSKGSSNMTMAHFSSGLMMTNRRKHFTSPLSPNPFTCSVYFPWTTRARPAAAAVFPAITLLQASCSKCRVCARLLTKVLLSQSRDGVICAVCRPVEWWVTSCLRRSSPHTVQLHSRRPCHNGANEGAHGPDQDLCVAHGSFSGCQ